MTDQQGTCSSSNNSNYKAARPYLNKKGSRKYLVPSDTDCPIDHAKGCAGAKHRIPMLSCRILQH
eukprot:scaffold93874_cov18-Tisochrysis_lutea.AAC.1